MSVDTRPVPTNLLRWPRTRDLITQHKGILLYLWPHPQQTACGCYLFPVDATAADLSMTSASLVDALREFARRGLVEWDEATCELWVSDWFRFYIPRTPAARGACEAAIKKIQSPSLRVKVQNAYESMLDPRKEKGKEKEKEAAARQASWPAPSAAVGVAAASISIHQTQGHHRQARRGDEKIVHGVEVWTPGDEETVELLVAKHGAEMVEKAAASLTPARTHRAPPPSALIAYFQQRRAEEEAQKKKCEQQQAAQAVAEAVVPPEVAGKHLATIRGMLGRHGHGGQHETG